MTSLQNTEGSLSLLPTVIDLAKHVRPGDTVCWSHAGAEPSSVIAQLLAQRHELGGINVLLTGVSYGAALGPEHADAIRFYGIGGLGTHRALTEARALDVLPCRFSDLPQMVDEGLVRAEVMIVAVSPPDAEGRVSLGPTVALSHELLAHARVTIAEVNPHIPYVLGDTLVPLDQFDVVVRSDRPAVVMPEPAPAGDRAKRICATIAELVPDGATLQLGIGSIANTLPGFLRDHRRLGVHSAILTDGIMELMRVGVADGSCKEIDLGIAVGGELIGTAELYRFADNNPHMQLQRSARVLAPAVLGAFDRLVSVNGALQVDLTGQVNAEVMGDVHVGAVGGSVDFVRAAARAPHGRSIIALPSTARGLSRIVPRLDAGVVTTARCEVDTVVTEFGRAELRGLPVSERARALVAIAHPDHREALADTVPL